MPLNEENEIDYCYNDQPKCPFCDHDIDISENEMYDLYKEDEHEIDCPDCGKEIKINSSCSWTFSTDEQED